MNLIFKVNVQVLDLLKGEWVKLKALSRGGTELFSGKRKNMKNKCV